MNLKKIVIPGLLFLLMYSGFAEDKKYTYVVPEDPIVQQKIEKWQDLKFGLLMHWGTYSQWGIVESWSLCSEDEPWCKRSMESYCEYKKAYENLQKTFNPVRFNPEKWAKAAKRAGIKYMIFTTKHHDGFCMFDTRTTDYKVTDPQCPFSKNPRCNIALEIFNAFRKEGLWTGAYFSKPDWHCKYYWWPYFATPDRHVNYNPSKYPEIWEKFKDYTFTQIKELMTEYGRIDILWLDGAWVRPFDNIPDEYSSWAKKKNYNQDIDIKRIADMARTFQPGLIVVDRWVSGPYENYLTPENRVPEKAIPYPWEACIISGGGWSWTPNARYKSPEQVIHTLIEIVAKGGNLLLNIAPGPDGTWDRGAYKLLDAVGEWMKINSEAIYNTRAIAPYKEDRTCFTINKKGKLFLVYLADKDEKIPEKLHVDSFLPADNAAIEFKGASGRLTWSVERTDLRFLFLNP